jgi:pimeloyl-ACP methyl ester carboxylesterase
MQQPPTRGTTAGVADAAVTRHRFGTADGLTLDLTRLRRADCEDVVLLVHGLTSSSDIFVMPEHRNLAGVLLDVGFTDVWTLDFRMSNRLPYNTEPGPHSLDDVALFDMPAALAELRRHVGGRRIHVVAHCLGSVSFSMALFGGLVDGVTSLVCNSVSLAVDVPDWSRRKLSWGPLLARRALGTTVLDPRASRNPAWTPPWMLSRLVSLAHPECDNPACHMISFMWGSGWPALYGHDKLDPVTHDRIADLLGPCDVGYYEHVARMVRAGHAVKCRPGDPRHAELPDDYLEEAGDPDTAILFLTGDRNHVFGDSALRCHRELLRRRPHRARDWEAAVIPGYGHLDTFIGRDAATDVFPVLIDFLKRKAG